MKPITFQNIQVVVSELRKIGLPVLVAFIVVLAGCATDIPSNNDRAPVAPVGPIDSGEDDIENARSQPGTGTGLGVEAEVEQAIDNISSLQPPEEAQAHLRTTLTNLYTNLPKDKAEREEEIQGFATAVCREQDPIPYEEEVEGSGDFHEYTYTVTYASLALNEQFNTELNTNKIESRMAQARGVTAPVSKYAPVVGSYNRFHNAACAYEPGDPDSEEALYIATAGLTAELIFMQHGVFYKASFAATGTAANQLSLMKIYHACGPRCYQLTLSQIHWGLRGSLAQAGGYIAETSTKYGIEISQDEIDHEQLYTMLQEEYGDTFDTEELFEQQQQRVEYCLNDVKDQGVLESIEDTVSEFNPSDLTVENVTDTTGNVDWNMIPDDEEDEFYNCVYNP